MLQNARAAAFTVSELLTENQQEGRGVVKLPPPPPTQIRVKYNHVYSNARVSTQVNRNQHEFGTNQHESDTSKHESTRVQRNSTGVRYKSTRINTSLN